MLVALTQELGEVLSGLSTLPIDGEDAQLFQGVAMAQLALKHRQNKNQRQRVVLFIGSPVPETAEELAALGTSAPVLPIESLPKRPPDVPAANGANGAKAKAAPAAPAADPASGSSPPQPVWMAGLPYALACWAIVGVAGHVIVLTPWWPRRAALYDALMMRRARHLLATAPQ